MIIENSLYHLRWIEEIIRNSQKEKKTLGPDGSYGFYLQNFEVIKNYILEILNANLSAKRNK